MSLLFQDDHIPLIRDGEKTVTRRMWDENYPRPNCGSIRAAVTEMFTPIEEADCFIKITGVSKQRLKEMDRRDFEAEGNYAEDEFRELWEELNGVWDPHLVVDVVEFEYVGREPTEPQKQLTEM